MTTIETRDGRPVAFEHAVEMAEYLCALDFGLDLIAKEERATPQSVADLFCTCFLHWETDYRQQQGFTEANNLYPIFGGYLLPTFRPCNAIACLPDRKSGGTN